ncbi:MAG TPA: alpha/beta hydrolase [Flavobacterium sp.]|nr:alpha/beta hydrolase [Flavobacterium sp.]
MEKIYIRTAAGQIAVFKNSIQSKKTPIIFLHGVYFDHHMWDSQISQISGRQVFAIDMPMHGESKTDIKKGWSLDDCAGMLLEIIDTLKIDKVIAIGHSWGSMAIVRAAYGSPKKFDALGLCNMPFKEARKSEKQSIRLQHLAIVFRRFYMKQAAKSLMGKESLANNPDLIQDLIRPMSLLANKEIKYTDRAVRIDAKDAAPIISSLKMPIIALVGEEDYVGIPPVSDVVKVKGGHVSPLEVPNEVSRMISRLIRPID